MMSFIDAYENMYPLAAHELSNPHAYRQRYDRIVATIDKDVSPDVHIEDITTSDSVVLRIFRSSDGSENKPCCIFLHGGGWSIGSLNSHSAWASDICVDANVTVILVDYRLAPEHPYPAAFDDCVASVDWIIEHCETLFIDRNRIVLYGDSAGGNLCAAISLHESVTNRNRICGQVLVYPALHSGEPLPSWIKNQHAPVLSLAVMQMCWNSYLRGQTVDAFAAPLLAKDFTSQPPSWIIAAELDPLYDDAHLYHQKLIQAGCESTIYDGVGLVHGCFRARRHSKLSKHAFQWSVNGVIQAIQD